MYQRNKSSGFKVKFRQTRNCYKRVLETAKLSRNLTYVFSIKVNLLYLLCLMDHYNIFRARQKPIFWRRPLGTLQRTLMYACEHTLCFWMVSSYGFLLAYFPWKWHCALFAKNVYVYDTNPTYLKRYFLNIFFKYISEKIFLKRCFFKNIYYYKICKYIQHWTFGSWPEVKNNVIFCFHH